MKAFGKLFSVLTINIVILCALLEGAARFFPVQDSTNVPAVNESAPYIHMEPNREITSSFGPRMVGSTKKKVNNYGYFSNFDYVKASKPKVIVIGDSYVEAMQVSNQDSVSGRLEELTGNTQSVYNIAFSGSPLSQYLAFAQYAQGEFDPQLYVFVIISNDFDESLTEFKSSPGFFYYKDDAELELVNYTPNRWKEIARNSAFLRYLFLNVHIQNHLKTIYLPEQAQVHYNNTIARASTNRLERSKQAVDWFLSDISKTLKTKDIIFVLDADRSTVYNGKKEPRNPEYYSNIMFEYFKQQSRKAGIQVVDMHPVLTKHYSENHQNFESQYDAHWNELGHDLVAKEILKALPNSN